MKKILVIALLIIALPLYGYNVYLLVRSAFPAAVGPRRVAAKPGISFEQILVAAAPVKFEDRGRDPFTLYKEPPKPAVVREVVKAAPKPPPASLPSIIISGILWNSDNPVAMIKVAGGKTVLAKTGQQIGTEITVKTINKKNIIILFGGKEFTIEKK